MIPCAFVFLTAGLLDEAVGDPEGWPHPVRLFGWLISCADGFRRRITAPAMLRSIGLLLAIALPCSTALFAWSALRLCGPWAWVAQIVLGAWMLAGRSLREAVRPVMEALEQNDLPLARTHVARVVGRDVAHLDESEVVRAGLETLAESLCDGVVAPLFWFAVGGLPALWAFKAVNTLDSMVGHREAPYTHFGWASARLDDLLNFLPARFTALLIALAAWSRRALRMAWRDGGKTASPNAGWCEAAFAGALDLQLGGINHYDGVPHEGPLLGDPGHARTVADLAVGLSLARRVNLLAIGIGTLTLAVLWRLHG
jgi:adenosylcobinamide-phosphate synthase